MKTGIKFNERQRLRIKQFIADNLNDDGKAIFVRHVLFSYSTIDCERVFELACQCFPEKAAHLKKIIEEL